MTVKSFSMARNIRYPGFQLLSVTDTTLLKDRSSFADAPCALPDQKGIIDNFYIPLMFVTLLGLLFLNYARRKRTRPPPVTIFPPTPNTPGASPLWPYAHRSGPTSPPGSLPSALRTPNSSGEPSFRATSHYPESPLGSPMFHGEEEDAMFPSQYASRDSAHDDAWSPDTAVGNGFFVGGESDEPLSAAPKRPAKWTWSWTFVLLGRRRRVTLRLPEVSWSGLKELVVLLGAGGTSDSVASRKGLVKSTLIDGLSILWSTVLFWVFLTWMS